MTQDSYLLRANLRYGFRTPRRERVQRVGRPIPSISADAQVP
jgi:hypothetical protein